MGRPRVSLLTCGAAEASFAVSQVDGMDGLSACIVQQHIANAAVWGPCTAQHTCVLVPVMYIWWFGLPGSVACCHSALLLVCAWGGFVAASAW